MIKIASIIPYKILPPVKGGEKAIFYFWKYFSKHAELHVISVKENAERDSFMPISPILTSTHNKWRYVNPALYFKVKKYCRRHGVNAVVMEHPYYAWLGYLLQRFAGIKWIIRSHNIEAIRFKTIGKWWWRILHKYEKFAHGYADYSFFITEEDRQYAIAHYEVNPSKTAVITYGIENNMAPSLEEKAQMHQTVCEELGLPPHTRLILFNGSLSYGPNRTGLEAILHRINPLLQHKIQDPYKIIICGSGLPAEYDELRTYAKQHILYKGFVEDIHKYFKAADVFINPITEGGGIKTKLVEALAANTPCVSFETGAWGVPVAVTGNHLSVVADGNYEQFVDAIINKLQSKSENIPSLFFEHFYWGAVVHKAADILKRL